MTHIHQPIATHRAKAFFARDVIASVVVFLVALPLCMGVAIASGAPPALGLVTGMIGGLLVGFLAGQPLQVSGPAAGLAVTVWQFIQDFGLEALGLAVMVAGLAQLAASLAGLGVWFRAVSPSVIQGMLSGIGVLIFASQCHVMVDDTPRGGGLANLLSIPEALYKGMFPLDGSAHHMAAAIGMMTIVVLLVWSRCRPSALHALPGPLVAVVLASLAASAMSLPIARVSVPENLVASLNWVTGETLSLLAVPQFWVAALGMAVVASAETLLCATAVDRMHDGPRTKYNRELLAQGIGNIACGVVGALPMTGVIVRSTANVEAGAKTKWSAILHGAWILGLVAFLPRLLGMIPTSSLAAILVYTGWKLLGIDAVRRLAKKSMAELLIWAATVATIVLTDLLLGVAVGFGLALARLLFMFTRLEVRVEHTGKRYEVELIGAATFVSLPKFAEAIEAIPDGSEVHFHLDKMTYVDHACLELIENWKERHGERVFLESDRLLECSRANHTVAA